MPKQRQPPKLNSAPMTAEKESVNKESTDKEKITKEEPIKEESIKEAVPTAERDNNEISFVLKASPATSEKQTASASSAQSGIQQSTIGKDQLQQLFAGRLFL